jgi:hypothetical protein
MEAMRSTWTDEWLDDLNEKVGDGFKRLDDRLNQIDTRFDSIHKQMSQQFITLVNIQMTTVVALFGLILIRT